MEISNKGRVVALAAIALTGTAVAGFQTGAPVTINDAGRYANGTLGYIHNSASPLEYMGCSTFQHQGYCTARDANGLTRSCSSIDARMVNTMRALNGDSYLYFEWDGDGNCVYIIVENISSTLPKK